MPAPNLDTLTAAVDASPLIVVLLAVSAVFIGVTLVEFAIRVVKGSISSEINEDDQDAYDEFTKKRSNHDNDDEDGE